VVLPDARGLSLTFSTAKGKWYNSGLLTLGGWETEQVVKGWRQDLRRHEAGDAPPTALGAQLAGLTVPNTAWQNSNNITSAVGERGVRK
jgi:hypothetical protein